MQGVLTRNNRALVILFVVIMGIALALPPLTRAAERPAIEIAANPAQNLPASPFYAWAYSPGTDTLTLLNATGVAATLPRPKLPNEVASLETPPTMSFSPDGQTMVLDAVLSSGQRGLGFYNLSTGQFVQTHTAQANEAIFLGNGPGIGVNFPTYAGSPYIFTADSSRMAVGFGSMTVENHTWRVIVFETSTGQVSSVLEGGNPQLAALNILTPAVAWFPMPIYYEGSGSEARVHVQFILGFTDGFDAERPTAVWNPITNTIAPSDFTRDNLDIMPTAGQIVFASLDSNIPALEPDGPFPAMNVIQRDTPPGNPTGPETLYSDTSSYLSRASWAANGQLVLFIADKPDYTGGQADFYVINVVTKQTTLLPADTRAVYPTPEGFLRLDALGQVFRHGVAAPATGQILWQSNDPNLRLLWSNPAGSTFRLASVSASSPTPSGTALCIGAPPSRVSVGVRARVTFSNENPQPLRMRAAPGGSFITQLPEGTEFSVAGGPQCQGNLTWWQARLADGRTGWVAEGSGQEYFIEPLPTGTVPTGDAVVSPARLNVRQSPGTGAAIVATLSQNETVRVTGRLSDNSWVQIQTTGGVTGWVLAQYLSINIELNSVPVINTGIVNPPTPLPPTPIPAATVAPTSAPAFSVFLTADAYFINAGQCATISWNVTGASALTFDNVAVAFIDSRVVCPTTTTSYMLLATPTGSVPQGYPILITVNGGY